MLNITISKLAEQVRKEIEELYSREETDAMIAWIFKHTLNLSRSDIYLYPETNVPKTTFLKIENIVEGLKKKCTPAVSDWRNIFLRT